MARFNKNRVEIAEDEMEPQNSFEMFERSPHESSTYGRSRSENIDDTSDSLWIRSTQTVRRARSLHRNAQQNAINFLPSRHVTNVGAVGNKIPGMDAPLLEDGSPRTQEHQVQQIVEQMEQVDDLMEDSPDAEEMRLEALRDLPQCLTIKRNIKAKITASVSRKSKHRPIGFFKRTKYRLSFWKKKAKQNFRNLIFSFELWYGSIKAIEGQYGSGVATYFRFLRWLFIMNVCVSVFLISFIVIPQALYTIYNNKPVQTASFKFLDIFTGQGFFTNTTLYYGFYSPETFSIASGYSYNIPYAYFFTMLIMYFAMFIVLSIRMARSYRVSFIETAGGFKNIYANKIFCGWDFGISSPEAATLKSRSIYNELKEQLSDSSKVKYKQTSTVRCSRLFIKVLVHGFAITLLCLVGVLMVTLLDDSFLDVPDVVTTIRLSNFRILLAVIVTLVMAILPIIFSFISRFEYYNDPRTAIFITLLRTFALEVVVVAILVSFWLRSKNKCWETSLGQEVYRLIIFDFLFTIILLPILDLMRSFISKCIWKKLGVPEFDIARNTLSLIYNQTLLWMGLFYSPILCAIVTLKMFIVFYMKRMSIQYTCQPSTRSWRAAQTETFFLVLIFMSLLAILLTLGYIFTGVLIGGCGPFVTYNYVYLVLVEGVFNLKEGHKFFTVIMYITKPGVVAFILIAMCVGAYYLRAKSLAQKSMVNILRDMLVLESKDKEFLLDAISKVSEGLWVYSQKQQNDTNSLLESSSTFKYLKDNDKIRKPSNADYQFDVANSSKKNLYDSPRSSAGPRSPSIKPSTSGLRRDYDDGRDYGSGNIVKRNTSAQKY